MKNKKYFLMALYFIALGEINAQSEDYAKYYNKANSLSARVILKKLKRIIGLQLMIHFLI